MPLLSPQGAFPMSTGTKWASIKTRAQNGDLQVAQGTVKWFSEQKGFGFIVPDEGNEDLFVHRSNVDTLDRTLRDEQRVEFEVGEGRKGPEATQVRPV